ncbi:MAG: LptA/OstA family protein [Sphingomonadaceae bacterium]|nr:LptA/OstA family protein [Sphingomonadaceae bacterium]
MDAMRSIFLLASAVTTLALAAPAASQSGLGSSALARHDTKAPIDIDAARIEVRDQESQAIFSGNVTVRQAQMTLQASQLRVFYEKARGDDLAILRIDAEGGVTMVSPSERVRGSYGVYDVEDRQLTIIGNVVLTRGGSVLRGQRLAIDLENGRSTLDGAGTGVAGGAAGSGSRVTGRFVVPERRANP